MKVLHKPHKMKALLRVVALSSIIFTLSTCDENDDYRYPSVRTDYVCFATDATGKFEYMRLDNGASYAVRFTQDFLDVYDPVPTFKPDTLYRLIGVYGLSTAEQNDSVADLYSIGSIISTIPTPLEEDEKLYQDPVYLQSIWLSGGYLNFVLEIKALNGKHSIGYVDTTPEGMKGKEFTFYHRVISDVESYRQKFYGSIPLNPFSEQLLQGDTLRFVVNTYEEGNKKFEYIM